MGNGNLNIVFDLDGTIIEHGKPLGSQKAKDIVRLTSGCNLFFASARPIRDMLPLIPEELRGATFIGCNGGQAWKNGDMIFSNQFPYEEIGPILALLKTKSTPYVIDSEWKYSFSQKKHDFQSYIESLSDFRVSEEDIIRHGVTKLLILCSQVKKDIEKFILSNNLKCSLHSHTHDNFFDLTPIKTNKAEALDKLGVEFENTLAIGNDYNDFDMLDNSKISIFVGETGSYDKASYRCSFDRVLDVVADIIKKTNYNH
ncbi:MULTISPECIES: HAD-IIB family hydrolase [Vibrionaceae]|uniref:Hydrolase n=2 Tax=Vibrionaceae TaxID=641 RepID=A0ABM9A8E5_9VIBR|nr:MULTISPECIES: HAD-IIB family hydrolase [Vibrionaceae]EAS66284.1 putative hydrolase [Photobacterium angustum S14]CAH0541818.1 hypothetical protein VMF7928_03863 [Vibrio marisflavi CECT 7928]